MRAHNPLMPVILSEARKRGVEESHKILTPSEAKNKHLTDKKFAFSTSEGRSADEAFVPFRKLLVYEKVCNFLWKTHFPQDLHRFSYRISTAFPIGFAQNRFPHSFPQGVFDGFPQNFPQNAVFSQKIGVSLRFQNEFCRNLARSCGTLHKSCAGFRLDPLGYPFKNGEKQEKARPWRAKRKNGFLRPKRWIRQRLWLEMNFPK